MGRARAKAGVCVCVNPMGFTSQGSEAEIAATRAAADGLAPRHTKGCNCKKSTCLKKYCECFQAAIYCSDMCKCVDCKNFEVRVQQGAVLGRCAWPIDGAGHLRWLRQLSR